MSGGVAVSPPDAGRFDRRRFAEFMAAQGAIEAQMRAEIERPGDEVAAACLLLRLDPYNYTVGRELLREAASLLFRQVRDHPRRRLLDSFLCVLQPHSRHRPD